MSLDQQLQLKEIMRRDLYWAKAQRQQRLEENQNRADEMRQRMAAQVADQIKQLASTGYEPATIRSHLKLRISETAIRRIIAASKTMPTKKPEVTIFL